MTPEDLCPPEGHRYLTEQRIEDLRQAALPGHNVTLPAITVIELICDWKNMAASLLSLADEVERLQAENALLEDENARLVTDLYDASLGRDPA